MPIHVFECERGHITEHLFYTISAAEGVDWILCIVCGKEAVRLVSSPSPAQFKGSGFYQTDYK